jgi:two-component system LytT family sensor kinase
MSRRLTRGLLVVAVFALLAGLTIAAHHAGTSGSKPATPTATPAWLVIRASFRYYLAWALVAPGLFWLARRFPLTGRPWGRPLAVHLLVPAAGSAPFLALVLLLNPVVGLEVPPFAAVAAMWRPILLMQIAAVLPLYWLVLGAATLLQIHRDAEASQLKAIELQRSLATAQLEALRMKLQPHFLFNTLNTIACLAREGDTDAVGQVVERLGALLRRSMETSGRQMVTLDEELALLDEQLAIEEIRHRDRLRVVRRIEPGSGSALVPNLILQPLVENAIAHGLSARLGANLLEICARRDGDVLSVAVRDDGPGLPPGWRLESGARRGLSNVIERLRALYAGAFRFDVNNGASGGAVAEMRLPFRSAAPHAAGREPGP